MPKPRTLTEAMDNLRAAWRDLIDKLEYPFGRGLHDMRSDLHNLRGLHVPVREAAARTYRIILIIAAANYVIVGIALLYAMATGQFDWSAQ